MEKSSKIYVAGHTGMVGSAIIRSLKEKGYNNIIGRTFEELDLTNQKAVIEFFEVERPEYVFLAAAKVGGIMANSTYRAQFIYENLMIQNNIIHQSYVYGIKKMLFLGSSCIYPKNCPQPIKEEYLLTGELEPTNEPYAIAKIAGIKMCENYYRQYGCNFVSAMPTNLYGPNDNYNLETSHVLPALMRKMYLAKCLEKNDWNTLRIDLDKRPIEGINGSSYDIDILKILEKYGIKITGKTPHIFKATINSQYQVSITLWGTGLVYRDFLHVDDLASACLQIMNKVTIADIIPLERSPITYLNIGSGIDQSIQELAIIIKKIVGFEGKIIFDPTFADGTPKKLLDISKIKAYGFKSSYDLKEGIEQVFLGYTGIYKY